MSAEANSWCVRSAGSLVDGFDRQAVVSGFASTFKVGEEKAITYLENGKLISNDLKEADAVRYKQKLEGIGLVVTLHDQTDPSAVAANASVFTTVAQASASSVGQAGADRQSDPSISSETPSFSCPKCARVQEKSDQCSGCGIYFEKYAQRENQSVDLESDVPPADSGASIGDGDFSIAAIGAAAIAALVFALIWKFVALQFDRELGLIAWAAGGAIGGVAVFFGGRGVLTAGVCAGLVVCSIFLGKYMFASSYMDEALAYIELDGDQSMVDVFYNEISAEREIYAAIPKDDNSIKRFMIDYDYTDATQVALVSADDFQYFKEDMEPWLLSSADGDSEASGNTLEDFRDAMGEITPWVIVKESLRPIDLLFLLLGVSTAFRLVQAGRQS